MSTVFDSRGYQIDLDQLYRAMYDQSEMENGERVFHGNSRHVRAVKRLLNDLFGVPVRDTVHPVKTAIRKEAETRMAELRWAQKDRGHSGRYVLHRDLHAGTSSFLLTWNPRRRFPRNERAHVIQETGAGKRVEDTWSVGSRTSGVTVGDRFYLMRLGLEPRGRVASGIATSSEISQEAHWDQTPGKTANYAHVKWDRAVDDSDLIPIRNLEEQIPTVNWSPQGGGVHLGDQEAKRLEALWRTTPDSVDQTDPTERRQAREAGYLADPFIRAAIE